MNTDPEFTESDLTLLKGRDDSLNGPRKPFPKGATPNPPEPPVAQVDPYYVMAKAITGFICSWHPDENKPDWDHAKDGLDAHLARFLRDRFPTGPAVTQEPLPKPQHPVVGSTYVIKAKAGCPWPDSWVRVTDYRPATLYRTDWVRYKPVMMFGDRAVEGNPLAMAASEFLAIYVSREVS